VYSRILARNEARTSQGHWVPGTAWRRLHSGRRRWFCSWRATWPRAKAWCAVRVSRALTPRSHPRARAEIRRAAVMRTRCKRPEGRAVAKDRRSTEKPGRTGGLCPQCKAG
jgi:hypothetical protein